MLAIGQESLVECVPHCTGRKKINLSSQFRCKRNVPIQSFCVIKFSSLNWSKSQPNIRISHRSSQRDHAMRRKIFFLKNWPTPASFSFIFILFKQTIQFLEQINVKKCPNVHLVQDTGIRTHDLLNMSHHPLPLDQGSRSRRMISHMTLAPVSNPTQCPLR